VRHCPGQKVRAVRRVRSRGPSAHGLDPWGTARSGDYSLIVTAKLNDVDPQAWLADVLARITAHPAHRIMRCCLELAAEIGPAQLGGLKQPL
jgi:hypothetical protein